MQERRKRGDGGRARWGALRLGGAPLSQLPAAADSAVGYYHYPPLKRPHWRWEIVLYFFVGGLASAAYVIAAIVELIGRPADRPICRAGRYLALGGLLISPPLLIRDLGRPERFHHMLRLFKTRSPMSVGSWALSLFGLVAGLMATRQAASDRLLGTSRPVSWLAGLPGWPLDLVGSPLAFFVGSYTGVLLAFTNVPLWARNHLWLGPLFLSSAMSTALAAITLLLERGRQTAPATLERLHRAELLLLTVELVLLLTSERALGRLARPLTTGPLALPYRLGLQLAGLVVPLALQLPVLAGRHLPPGLSRLAAGLVLAGGLLLRWLTLEAGKLSAEDPAAVFATRPDQP